MTKPTNYRGPSMHIVRTHVLYVVKQAGHTSDTYSLSKTRVRKRMCGSSKSMAFDLKKPPGSKNWLRVFHM